MRKKIVLAYSGGLDTSVCLKWLESEFNYDVIAYIADVGQPLDHKALEKRAMATGAVKVYIDDLKKEFAEDFIFPSLKANAVYESGYLLATALSRPLIASRLVKAAGKESAEGVAHGCTGKGNDQVRFELAISALAGDLKVIAPVRKWKLKSREDEISYAKRHNIPLEVTKDKLYSIDMNLWGTSVECGILEDPWVEPPRDTYITTKHPADTPKSPVYHEIYFEGGIPTRLDGKSYSAVNLIDRLNKAAGNHGVGRSDLVENRLVGIKSREIYEAPAATVLYAAHRALEALVLDRELLHFKEGVSLKYAELIYYGLWYSPLREALDRFIEYTQKKVTGSVRVKLYKGSAVVCGRKSPYSLYDKKLATYGDEDTFDQSMAEGFIKIWGLPYEMQKSKFKNQNLKKKVKGKK